MFWPLSWMRIDYLMILDMNISHMKFNELDEILSLNRPIYHFSRTFPFMCDLPRFQVFITCFSSCLRSRLACIFRQHDWCILLLDALHWPNTQPYMNDLSPTTPLSLHRVYWWEPILLSLTTHVCLTLLAKDIVFS